MSTVKGFRANWLNLSQNITELLRCRCTFRQKWKSWCVQLTQLNKTEWKQREHMPTKPKCMRKRGRASDYGVRSLSTVKFSHNRRAYQSELIIINCTHHRTDMSKKSEMKNRYVSIFWQKLLDSNAQKHVQLICTAWIYTGYIRSSQAQLTKKSRKFIPLHSSYRKMVLIHN